MLYDCVFLVTNLNGRSVSLQFVFKRSSRLDAVEQVASDPRSRGETSCFLRGRRQPVAPHLFQDGRPNRYLSDGRRNFADEGDAAQRRKAPSRETLTS
jgi:hypothetical protein